MLLDGDLPRVVVGFARDRELLVRLSFERIPYAKIIRPRSPQHRE